MWCSTTTTTVLTKKTAPWSLFIDEGFGSLDGETLDTAMKALAALQNSGRLIGLISHVSELKNRIPCRIEVTRDAAGFSHASLRAQ